MLEDDCPTCGARRTHTTCTGIEKRRFPRGKLGCQFEKSNWHQQLENLKRNFDLTRSQTIKTIIQQEMETIILEHCQTAFDFPLSSFLFHQNALSLEQSRRCASSGYPVERT